MCYKTICIISDITEKIYDSIINDNEYNKDKINIEKVNSLEEAVNVASKKAKDGDIVIMSPASASFDMFKSYKQRGNIFKGLVNNL